MKVPSFFSWYHILAKFVVFFIKNEGAPILTPAP